MMYLCEGRAPAKCRLVPGMARSLFMGRRERAFRIHQPERRPGWIILRASGVINIKLLRIKNETVMRGWWAAPATQLPHIYIQQHIYAAALIHSLC